MFISDCLGISEIYPDGDDREYDLQIAQRFTRPRGNGFVVAISDAKPDTRIYSVQLKDSIPDALIQFNNVSFLVEVKLGDGRVDLRQLDNHVSRFSEGEEVHPPKFITWQYIYFFLNKVQDRTLYSWNDVTSFLLNQYLSYCEHMGFVDEKGESFVLFISSIDLPSKGSHHPEAVCKAAQQNGSAVPSIG